MAVSFASDKPELSPPRFAVVYHILWKMGLWGCWFMDKGAFPHEREVLIFDGCAFEVLGVSKQTLHGKEVTVVKLKV